MEDKKLLRLLQKDPSEGLAQLMRLYSALLYTVVKGKLQGSYFISSDVEDLVADTFSEFYLELDRYDPSVSSIRSYLCVLARHNAADLLRKRQKQRGDIPVDEAVLSEQTAEDSTIESNLAEKELRQAVIAEICLLGHPDADILWRKYYLGQSTKEIAHALKLSVSVVDTRTHRAIVILRKLLGGKEKLKRTYMKYWTGQSPMNWTCLKKNRKCRHCLWKYRIPSKKRSMPKAALPKLPNAPKTDGCAWELWRLALY